MCRVEDDSPEIPAMQLSYKQIQSTTLNEVIVKFTTVEVDRRDISLLE